MKKINVALIGSGLIAATHAKTILALGHRLKYICSRDNSNSKAFAQKWGADEHGVDFQRALSNDIDCVHICTPPALHFDMAKAALLANKHVVCEKPLCTNAVEAATLHQLALESQKVNAVVFNVRFHKACEEARRIIQQEEFGNIVLVHGHYLQEFHALPDGYSWRYQADLAGRMRATTEIGSHWIDLVRYLSNLEITAVSATFHKTNPSRQLANGIMQAQAHTDTEPIEVSTEDIAAITLRFSNGAIGNVLLSEVSHGHTNTLNVEIVGTQQAVAWNNENPYLLAHSTGKFKGITSKSHSFEGGFSDTFVQAFTKIYEDIVQGRPSMKPQYPVFEDGYRNARICDAIFESAARHSTWVEI